MSEIPADIKIHAKKYAKLVRNGILTVEEIFEAAILAERQEQAATSTQRERRLFEALYALAKAAEALTTGRGEFWQVFASLEAALVEANEALAYPTTPDGHAQPGQDAP